MNVPEVLSFLKINSLMADDILHILGHFGPLISNFKPLSLEEDLKIGSLNRMIYYYDDYINDLYSHVMEKKPVEEYFNAFNPELGDNFKLWFPNIYKKLNRIATNKVKYNAHGEIVRL